MSKTDDFHLHLYKCQVLLSVSRLRCDLMCLLNTVRLDGDAYLVGKRWVARHTETRAPCGTGSLSVPVRNGPVSRKLPQAHNRNPTFPAVGVSAAPSLAGVRRTPEAPTATRGPRSSTSCFSETATGVKLGLNSLHKEDCKLEDVCPDSYIPYQRGREI